MPAALTLAPNPPDAEQGGRIDAIDEARYEIVRAFATLPETSFAWMVGRMAINDDIPAGFRRPDQLALERLEKSLSDYALMRLGERRGKGRAAPPSA